ncbi:MAG: hypothetical protein RBS38_13545 [Bacteroidales bacterium]|jgi:hypothetical protein|nr:hypothetical protein [Bacteroidales bacterium]
MKNLFILITVITSALASCEKLSESGLEIYLLTDYQKKFPGAEILSGSEKLSENPIISYNDIILYDSAEHYFQISESKAQELRQIKWGTQGAAFSLTINKHIIYSGYFMPGYSSLGLDWISIDPLAFDSKIRVTLGYPVDWPQFQGPDPRNDSRLINYLRKDNKLKQ